MFLCFAHRYFRRGNANYDLQGSWPAGLGASLPPHLQGLLGTTDDKVALESSVGGGGGGAAKL